jgi:hypothetical protein
MCAAIRSPLRKISTVRAVSRASTSARNAVIMGGDLDVIIEPASRI